MDIGYQMGLHNSKLNNTDKDYLMWAEHMSPNAKDKNKKQKKTAVIELAKTVLVVFKLSFRQLLESTHAGISVFLYHFIIYILTRWSVSQ